MSRPITVGLDGSPESSAAADWAAREALRRGLPLLLVHGWARPLVETPDVHVVEEQDQRAQQILNEAAAVLAGRYPGLSIDTERPSDLATNVLVSRAEDSEMLVLGSRGHGAVAGFLLGSIGMRVIARAPGPVVMVRAGVRAAVEKPGDEVVVALQDYGRSADELLRFAFTAAAARGTTLRAVHGWGLPPVFAYSPASMWLADQDGSLEREERKALAAALEHWRERFPGTAVIEDLELGSGADVALEAASRAALVVVGRRLHRPTLGMRIGPVTHAVLHHTACPVAVVPHDD